MEIVRLDVTATDRGGRYVTDLEAEDFQVLEDGVPQRLSLFIKQSAPLDLVLMLDASGSMAQQISFVQKAASAFVRALGPDDAVRVVQFSDRVTVLQDFTSDRGALEQAVEKPSASGPTALHNALYDAIRTLHRRARGSAPLRRPVVVLLSDGDDTVSVITAEQVLDFARRSEVALYAINLVGGEESAGESRRLLELLARETGGRLVRQGSLEGLVNVYEDIATELRTRYSLGYVASDSRPNGTWRRIAVLLSRRRGLELRSRAGYYVGAGRSAAAIPAIPVRVAVADPPGRTSSNDGGPRGADVVPDSALAGTLAKADGVGWLEMRDGRLAMRLAHKESRGIDYGILRADPDRRRLQWAPAPVDGCQESFDVPFEAVGSVGVRAEGGLSLEVRQGPPRSLWLLPAQHASLFDQTRGPGRAEPAADVAVDTRAAVARLSEALGRSTSRQAVFELLYGYPVAASVADLLGSSAAYEGRSVRVRGKLEVVSRSRGRYRLSSDGALFSLSDDNEYTLSLVPGGQQAITLSPFPEMALLAAARSTNWEGEEIEVTGVFRLLPPRLAQEEGGAFAISFWEMTAPRPPETAGRAFTLAELAAADGGLDGQLVRVLGQFRGTNLYGDMPIPSRRESSDWVIKDGDHAVWVSGRPPSGSGWGLDANSAKHATQWLQVIGRPRTRKGLVYLDATKVSPSAPPPGATVRPAKLIDTSPPTVIFALPEDGEEISSQTQFLIQFSHDMDAATLRDQIRLRYEGSGASAFDRIRVTYSDHRRYVVIDPGVPLRPGASVECLLPAGVMDAHGRPLRPRDGVEDGHEELLRFHVRE